MDPLTAALQLATVLAENYGKLLDAASDEQKRELLQGFIEFEKGWRAIFAHLQPGGSPS